MKGKATVSKIGQERGHHIVAVDFLVAGQVATELGLRGADWADQVGLAASAQMQYERGEPHQAANLARMLHPRVRVLASKL